MLKIMITGAVILKGKNGAPAVKITEFNQVLYASFRIAMRVYDPKKENNIKWLYLTVKASRWMADRIQKMQLSDGQRINIDGSLEEDCWIGNNGVKQYMPYISLNSIEKAEKGEFIKLFGTQMYISKGANNTSGIRYTERSAMFRMSHSIYDKSAENNRRWMNSPARAFGSAMKAMQNLSLDGGSCINFWGRLDVSIWENEAGELQYQYQIIVDEIEPARQLKQSQTGNDGCQESNGSMGSGPAQTDPGPALSQFVPKDLTYLPNQNFTQTGETLSEENNPYEADNPFASEPLEEPVKQEKQPGGLFLGYEVFGGKSLY